MGAALQVKFSTERRHTPTQCRTACREGRPGGQIHPGSGWSRKAYKARVGRACCGQELRSAQRAERRCREGRHQGLVARTAPLPFQTTASDSPQETTHLWIPTAGISPHPLPAHPRPPACSCRRQRSASCSSQHCSAPAEALHGDRARPCRAAGRRARQRRSPPPRQQARTRQPRQAVRPQRLPPALRRRKPRVTGPRVRRPRWRAQHRHPPASRRLRPLRTRHRRPLLPARHRPPRRRPAKIGRRRHPRMRETVPPPRTRLRRRTRPTQE
jgi:hypothetical protein